MDIDALFEDAFAPLLRYCHRLTGDADVAEDLAQEAFVRLVSRDVEGPPAALRAWLFRVATHLIRDRYRVSENRRRLLEAHRPELEAEPGADGALERAETVSRVRDVLDALPERDRAMLLMREEGFSYKEIGESVGVRPTSVGTLLARAQQRFADAFASRIGES